MGRVYFLLVQALHTDLSRNENHVAEHGVPVSFEVRVQVVNKCASSAIVGEKCRTNTSGCHPRTLGMLICVFLMDAFW